MFLLNCLLTSLTGGRHSNDHADICAIRILPTSDEITSTKREYLPILDPSEHRVKGIDGLLDRQFRLLREDTVGQLRDAVARELRILQAGRGHQKMKKSVGMRIVTYARTRILDFKAERRSGFQFLVEFDEPSQLRRYSRKQRQDSWDNSKRLQADSLVCVLDKDGTAIFCSVLDGPGTLLSKPFHPDLSDKNEKDQPNVKDHDKAGSKAADKSYGTKDGRALVVLTLANLDDHDSSQVADRFVNGFAHFSLIEFPGVLLPAFEPTLLALQRMKKAGDLPFSQFLATADEGEYEGAVAIPPPLYATRRAFRFNLKCLTTHNEDLWLSAQESFDIAALQQKSRLDNKQAAALVNGLTRALAMIQGPPGTGKSYVGVALIKVLLANKKISKTTLADPTKADIGPVLCVCYTNHALDQLLEHLVEDGVKQVIRIGSRSKSEILEPLNLREVCRKMEQTKAEKEAYYHRAKDLEQHEKALNEAMIRLRSSYSLPAIKAYLQKHHIAHYRELFGKDDEGFELVKHGKKVVIGKWIDSGSNGQVERPIATLQRSSLHAMSRKERQTLHQHWLSEILKERKRIFVSILQDFQSARESLGRLRTEMDLRCLRQSNVIGVTTSGLARNLDLLRRCQPKVMLCEEAGEVLEAHTLTAFLPSIEHAILIGDHLQLRPQVQDYGLSVESARGVKHSLDLSLFERLVAPPTVLKAPHIPFTTLDTQRRMHPSISQLVRNFLYPNLQDHPIVMDYPEVTGMKQRLFWLQHSEPETGASEENDLSTSHSNKHEIEWTMALVAHLVRQGAYKPSDIAVLTPYLGQLQQLRRALSLSFEIAVSDRDVEDLDNAGIVTDAPKPNAVRANLLTALRIATVDNFQGEEAKVVVISLVRSNYQQKCGFLRTSNRINVLLSRAKHGMYIIGNADTSGHVAMWAKTIDTLRKEGNFDTALELQCPRHPQVPITVAKPDDFPLLSPEGGCSEKCGKRLNCGHVCTGRCHAEHLHDAVQCLEPCVRSLLGCDHECPLPCGVKCQLCKRTIPLAGDARLLSCGHAVDALPCWRNQDRSSVRCDVAVMKEVPGCKHTIKVPCHVDITAESFRCSYECGELLPCGHSCKRKCFECRKNAKGIVSMEHGQCKQRCGRAYNTCNHACNASCHGAEVCPLCQAPCEVRCSHSRCSKKCSEPCAPCAEEKCDSSCPHGQCTLPCSVPCNRVPCSMRCVKLLECGHQCKFLIRIHRLRG